MAVSGLKTSDFQASVSRGSAEDFEHSCDSCLADDQHVEAHGFCVNCQEYLCKLCLRYHQRNKASKHHKLLAKDEMDKHTASTKPVEVCTEKCSIHMDEIIKFFCPRHEDIGCTDCMTMNHRTCNLDYIPDKCAGIGDSNEYREIMRKIEEKMTEASTVVIKATTKDKDIDCSYDRVNEDFVTFRKEINDHLDSLQKKIATNAKKKKSTNKQEVQAVLASCTAFTSSMKQLQSSLKQDKASGQNVQLFIDMERAKTRLQSQEIEQAGFVLDKINIQTTFNRNTDLESILSIENFGKLTEFSSATAASYQATAAATPPTRATGAVASTRTDAVDSRKPRSFRSINHKADINIRTKADTFSCGITGIAVLSSSKIVLSDNANKALKLVDIQTKAVVEEKKLETGPYDIAVLPQDQIAVTLPDKKQIIIMTTTGRMTTNRSIEVKRKCRSIISHQDCLYVLCYGPLSVSVLDKKGNIKNTISLEDKKVLCGPFYMALSQDHRLLYVSDAGISSIMTITLQSEQFHEYYIRNDVGPMGILVLDDRSLLACCSNNTIHHVSADLTQGQTVMAGLINPRSICYSADRSQVYVAGKWNDQLTVCDILYNI